MAVPGRIYLIRPFGLKPDNNVLDLLLSKFVPPGRHITADPLGAILYDIHQNRAGVMPGMGGAIEGGGGSLPSFPGCRQLAVPSACLPWQRAQFC